MMAEEPIRTVIARMTLPRDIDHDRVLSRSLVAASGENVQVNPRAFVQELVVAGFWACKWALKKQF